MKWHIFKAWLTTTTKTRPWCPYVKDNQWEHWPTAVKTRAAVLQLWLLGSRHWFHRSERWQLSFPVVPRLKYVTARVDQPEQFLDRLASVIQPNNRKINKAYVYTWGGAVSMRPRCSFECMWWDWRYPPPSRNLLYIRNGISDQCESIPSEGCSSNWPVEFPDTDTHLYGGTETRTERFWSAPRLGPLSSLGAKQ